MTEINLEKYSAKTIEINKVFCPHCGNPFFEINNYELAECPLCEASLVNMEIECDSQHYVRVYVNPRTGRLNVWESDQIVEETQKDSIDGLLED
jgi:hypothetical protein